LGERLSPNALGFVILHPLPCLPSRVFSFDSFIQNTRKVTEEGYSVSRLSEVQEPHPQPPKSKRGACSDVPHVIRKRYK